LHGGPARPHAAFADVLEGLLTAGDDGAGLLAWDISPGLLRAAGHRPVEEVAGPLVGAQQSLDVASNGRVVGAFPIQVSGPLAGRQGDGSGKNGFTTIGHGSPSWVSVSLR